VPEVESKRRALHLRAGDLAIELQADRGVFGSRAIDLGTLTLLKEAPLPPPSGELLDLGSGYGPIAIALARRYELDSRDQAGDERLRTITASDGIWDCSFVGECSAVCPKGVDPARAIQQTKFDSTLGVLLPWGGK
jgi:hypothetical protein